MNPVLWGGVVVILLIVIAAVTMGKTNGVDRSWINDRRACLATRAG